jgi:hypothetical protein
MGRNRFLGVVADRRQLGDPREAAWYTRPGHDDDALDSEVIDTTPCADKGR